MDLACEKAGDVAFVVLPGEALDAGNVGAFQDSMESLLHGNPKMVLDLSSVRFVDSAGLVAMLWCLRRLAAEGGDLKLLGVARPVRALLDLLGMDRVFHIANSREEALGEPDPS